jgi:hypothetical protein
VTFLCADEGDHPTSTLAARMQYAIPAPSHPRSLSGVALGVVLDDSWSVNVPTQSGFPSRGTAFGRYTGNIRKCGQSQEVRTGQES